MTDLRELLKRVERTTVPDREIDRELMRLTHYQDRRYIGCRCWDDENDTCCPGARHLDAVWVDRETDKWATTAADGYEFTASVDAALALIGRVLPGWAWSVGILSHGAQAYLMSGPRAKMHGSAAPTPALALCAALLAAMIGEEAKPSPPSAVTP